MGVSPFPAVGGTEVYADMERWTEIRRNVLTGAMSNREACRHYQGCSILSAAQEPGEWRLSGEKHRLGWLLRYWQG